MATVFKVRWRPDRPCEVESRSCSIEEVKQLVSNHRLFHLGPPLKEFTYRCPGGKQSPVRTPIDDVVIELSAVEAEYLPQTLYRSGHFLIEDPKGGALNW
jgi:hypothetical protein